VITINIVLAIVPALLILLWAYRRDRAHPEPRRLVLAAFLLGLVAVLAALVAGFVTAPLGRMLSGYADLAFKAFFQAGLLEEAAKLAVVLLVVARHPAFDEVADGIVYVMAASLGFAAVENVLYIGETTSVLLIRAITAVPMHGAVGGIMGYFVGLSRIEHRGSVVTGLLLAVVVHGLYDFVLFAGGLLSFAAIGIVVASMVTVARLFRTAVARDIEAGRSRRSHSPLPHLRPPAGPSTLQ
jgi:RsiW-degrading membrane proteinase PrsW (M82 family)